MIIFTIEDLYNWAKEKGIENWTVFVSEEGCAANIDTDCLEINEENGYIYL